jgi:hypothetical protein
MSHILLSHPSPRHCWIDLLCKGCPDRAHFPGTLHCLLCTAGQVLPTELTWHWHVCYLAVHGGRWHPGTSLMSWCVSWRGVLLSSSPLVAGGLGCSSVAELLPSTCEALGSILNTKKENKRWEDNKWQEYRSRSGMARPQPYASLREWRGAHVPSPLAKVVTDEDVEDVSSLVCIVKGKELQPQEYWVSIIFNTDWAFLNPS